MKASVPCAWSVHVGAAGDSWALGKAHDQASICSLSLYVCSISRIIGVYSHIIGVYSLGFFYFLV